jgi:TonB family protein
MRIFKAAVEKNKWVRIVFGSIALHLAALSVLSMNGFFAPANVLTEVVFVGSDSNSKSDVETKTQSPTATNQSSTESNVQSQAINSSSNAVGSNEYLIQVHRQILQALSELPIGRSSQELSMTVTLNIESNGEIRSIQLSKSSGDTKFDDEVINEIRKTQIPAPPNSQNLQLVVPIRLIR